jgi:thiamine-phosphate pyrophosphorylase
MKLDPIYAIINVTDLESTLNTADKFFTSGIKTLQLRDKTNNLSDKIHITKSILKVRTKINPKAKVIINDFLEVAIESDADGLHLGKNDDDPILSRSKLGPKKIIGLSCNNIEDLKNAPISYLSYVACGPIFESKTKSGHAHIVGINNLKKFCSLSSLPVVAIGGINKLNAKEVFLAGASSCAMINELQIESQLNNLIVHFESLKNSN